MKKAIVILVIFFLSPVIAFADCESTIATSDTIGDVKAKLKCLADDNASLKSNIGGQTS